jgi:hypothetical protein
MSSRDKTVFQAFWHGPELTELHFAALSSFVSRGHAVHLYSYRTREVPPGVDLRDAAEILPESSLFHFRNPHTSVPDLGPFSDLFRFNLLYLRGGWYVDVDTFCIGENIPAYAYAWARDNPAIYESVGPGQIAMPAGSPLAQAVASQSSVRVEDFSVREDVGPRLLTKLINDAELPLDMNGSTETFYPVKWIESATLWLPDFSDEIAERIERATFLPYYQSMPRYLGLLDAGLPPDGSILRRLLDAEVPRGKHHAARAVAPSLVSKRAIDWIATVPWAGPEFLRVTGRDPLVLRDGPQTYDKLLAAAQGAGDPSKEPSQMTSGLDRALVSIDEAIIGLFRERERLVATITEASAKQSSLSPFIVPFAVGAKRRVRPFEELAPGFWIGFPNSFDPSVSIVQHAEANPLLAPPDHHFVIGLDIEDPKGTPWLTIEELVEKGEPNTSYRITVALKARGSRRVPIKFELSVPQDATEDHRFPLGTLTVGREHDALFLSQTVDFSDVRALAAGGRPKILAFLPVDSPISLAIAYYRVLMTKL